MKSSTWSDWLESGRMVSVSEQLGRGCEEVELRQVTGCCEFLVLEW